MCVCVRERGEGKEKIRFKNSFKTVKWSRVLGLCVLIGIASGEESNVWAVAGDQVILTLTGIDQTKLALVSLLSYIYIYLNCLLSLLFPCHPLFFSLRLGSVLCSPDSPVSVTSLVRARIIIFNIELPITAGYPVS